MVNSKDSKTGCDLPVVCCPVCGFVQQRTLPTDEELSIYYSHNYRLDYKSTYVPQLKHVDRAGRAALKRLSWLHQFAAPQASMKLIDVGAGGGEFVYLASRLGFDAYGVEPNRGYSEFAKREYGIEVRTEMVDDLPRDSANVVTLFHVLEHIANPSSLFEKLWYVLQPNGCLLVEVPNILQVDASPANIFFKAHLHYFSRSTLTAFASPWFDVERFDDCGNLTVLFKRRDVALDRVALPSRVEVSLVAERLGQKGWFEYLIVGAGWKKPFKKIRAMFHERKLVGSPRDLLDRQFADWMDTESTENLRFEQDDKSLREL